MTTYMGPQKYVHPDVLKEFAWRIQCRCLPGQLHFNFNEENKCDRYDANPSANTNPQKNSAAKPNAPKALTSK
jgi:hypothetical protein